MRPSELRRSIKGISERLLFDRLSRMVEAGIVGKRTNNRYPKESFYYLKDPRRFNCLVNWVEDSGISPEEISKLFSCKWTLIILNLLKEPMTPSCLKERVGGISDKVLHQRLKALERLGLVERVVLPERPIRVTYSLSSNGWKLIPELWRLKSVIFGLESHLVQTEKT